MIKFIKCKKCKKNLNKIQQTLYYNNNLDIIIFKKEKEKNIDVIITGITNINI